VTERRQLGRGLGALIPTTAPILDLTDRSRAEQAASAAPAALARYQEVSGNRIRPNPHQPRKIFDEAAHAELVHSVQEIGLLQPIVVRALRGDPDADFEIVAGERRWRACQDAGIGAVPVIIRETSDDALLQESLLENLHRANLNPLEEGAAYNQLLHDFDCTQEQLAKRLGRSRSQVANSIRLLRLPTAVQRRVAAGVLSAGHARALLGLSEPGDMESLAARIVAEGLSVRDVEEIVAVHSRGRKPPRSRQKRQTPIEYQAVADRLSERLDTRVVVSAGAKRGRIVIDFGDVDDLARIVQDIDGRLNESAQSRAR
jgi:ParB family transcriptional regulator, chromosome partitioning protein